MCKHDQVFETENEYFGGLGCPLCNRERLKRAAAACPVCRRTDPHDWEECAREDLDEWRAYEADRAANARPYLN